MTTYYKIRDEKTGLYSGPGYCPDWSELGHYWTTLGSLESHLKLYCRGQYPGESKKVPKSWTVVEVEIRENVFLIGPAADMIKGYKPPIKKIPKRTKKR